ncbi:hypothetical protein [Rothia aerolata]|uniref:Adenylate kinase n=1 Tax=Rothia aerolata TaxID=1812262 RepID=A0A917ITL8_9MICC|nr:hypothetical protein [Rothia aerolata]GGH62439.1 adenylate kinase [Rothia aerolata]
MPQSVDSRSTLMQRLENQVTLYPARPFLLALDGRSGAGKTTLAGQLADFLKAAGFQTATFHLEDTYQGWWGLSQAVSAWEKNSAELKAGGQLTFTGWDWETSRPTGPHIRAVLPRSVLIIEGVGASAGSVDFSCWVEAPTLTRKHRALTRDGETYRPWWNTWAEQEEELLAQRRLDQKVDLVFFNEGEVTLQSK